MRRKRRARLLLSSSVALRFDSMRYSVVRETERNVNACCRRVPMLSSALFFFSLTLSHSLSLSLSLSLPLSSLPLSLPLSLSLSRSLSLAPFLAPSLPPSLALSLSLARSRSLSRSLSPSLSPSRSSSLSRSHLTAREDDDDAVWRNALKAKAQGFVREEGGEAEEEEEEEEERLDQQQQEQLQAATAAEEKREPLSKEQQEENRAKMQSWRQHVLRARATLQRAQASAEDAKNQTKETEMSKEQATKRLGERKRQLELMETAYGRVKQNDEEKKTQEMRDVARRMAGE